jgi:Mrp family chromosome partitioning ATPase
MTEEVSVSDIYKALSQVKHPEHEARNLVELEMIHRVDIKNNHILIEVALPFPNLPIEGQLIDSVRKAVTAMGHHLEVDIKPTQMTAEQRADFMVRLRGEEPTRDRQRVGHVIAVMSGKGGVGKSSVAGLLAAALRREGSRVGVLDADITGPSIPKMFGVHHPPTASPQGILPVKSRTGIKLMSINLLLQDEGQPVVWRGPLIGRTIEQFWQDIVWGDLDYLVIDLPPGTSDAALTVMQMLPVKGFVLVTSPQDLAGMVVRKAANMAMQLGIPLIGLVENMSYAICPECGAIVNVFGPSRAEETAQQIGTRLLGHIPLDTNLAVQCDNGNIEDYRCDSFEPIVQQVLEAMPVKPPDKASHINEHTGTGVEE